ncbi:stabilizer of iron transporter SufD /Polynucleotidyl transferase [Striga asiatica]|uniref:Stabilizer of iron transporter SufD /Polynucleotidyl transferase n=1 Tax=Striga asiatica TaxID=4170 RepID=A0A5A7Q9V5_STRAF|nr:stabilizer of iron transporter SufD /Polynucleotidyl transferase [Striga asiatica]
MSIRPTKTNGSIIISILINLACNCLPNLLSANAAHALRALGNVNTFGFTPDLCIRSKDAKAWSFRNITKNINCIFKIAHFCVHINQRIQRELITFITKLYKIAMNLLPLIDISKPRCSVQHSRQAVLIRPNSTTNHLPKQTHCLTKKICPSFFVSEQALSTLGKAYSLHLTSRDRISRKERMASFPSPFWTYPETSEDQETKSGSGLSSIKFRAWPKNLHFAYRFTK